MSLHIHSRFAHFLLMAAFTLVACSDQAGAGYESASAPVRGVASPQVEVVDSTWQAEDQSLLVTVSLPVGLTVAAQRTDMVLSAQVGYRDDLRQISFVDGRALLLRDAERVGATGSGRASVRLAIPLTNRPHLAGGFDVRVLVPGLSQTGPGCPNGCNGNGFCAGGSCHCLTGFGGPSCGVATGCPGACSGRGVCIGGACACLSGFSGNDCGTATDTGPTCPNQCSGNGVCFSGICSCLPGWGGNDCSGTVACPNQCSGNGTCVDGSCTCSGGYTGNDCSIPPPCPGLCSNQGTCVGGKCFCRQGFTGLDCSTRTN